MDGPVSFTRLLMEAEYDPNMYVGDGVGSDNEYELSQTDEEDGDHVDQAFINQVPNPNWDAAPNPNWHKPLEPYPVDMLPWHTWNGNSGGEDDEDFAKDQIFGSLDELKARLAEYSAKYNKPYRTTKANQEWYTVACKRKELHGCEWRLSARRLGPQSQMWRIVRYNSSHMPNCVGNAMEMDNRNFTAHFIRGEILDLIRVDQTLKPSVIIQHIHSKHSVYVSYTKAWKAKQKAIAQIFGDWEQSYTELPQYMTALVNTNPGTVVEFAPLYTNDTSVILFGRVFWSFGPSIEGFKHCRPVLSIDGTHLYGKYKHVMMIAMAVDAEQQVFPLAFAIVENESNESWSWFMDCIGRRVTDRIGLCVISDRHHGIFKAMELPRWAEPNAYHRVCIRHLKSNINKHYKNIELKKLVGWTAYQPEVHKFNDGMARIKQISGDAYEDLTTGCDPKMWSLAHDGAHRYGLMTTNLSECFNGALKGARCLPITAIVQQTMYRLNGYFIRRRDQGIARAAQGFKFSEVVLKAMDSTMKEGRRGVVTTYDKRIGEFGVVMTPIEGRGRMNSRSYTVKLGEPSCTCDRYKLLKFPCRHVMAVCRAEGIDYAPYVDPLYSTEEY